MNIGRFIDVMCDMNDENDFGIYKTRELNATFDGTTDAQLQAEIDVCLDRVCSELGIKELAWVVYILKLVHIGDALAYVVLSIWPDDDHKLTHRIIPVKLTKEEIKGIIALNAQQYADDLKKIWL